MEQTGNVIKNNGKLMYLSRTFNQDSGQYTTQKRAMAEYTNSQKEKVIGECMNNYDIRWQKYVQDLKDEDGIKWEHIWEDIVVSPKKQEVVYETGIENDSDYIPFMIKITRIDNVFSVSNMIITGRDRSGNYYTISRFYNSMSWYVSDTEPITEVRRTLVEAADTYGETYDWYIIGEYKKSRITSKNLTRLDVGRLKRITKSPRR